jgi:hypothetical protein
MSSTVPDDRIRYERAGGHVREIRGMSGHLEDLQGLGRASCRSEQKLEVEVSDATTRG